MFEVRVTYGFGLVEGYDFDNRDDAELEFEAFKGDADVDKIELLDGHEVIQIWEDTEIR